MKALPHKTELLSIAAESRGLLPLLNLIEPQYWGRRDLFNNDTLREVSAKLAPLGNTHLRCLRKLPCSVLCKLYYHNRLREALDLLLGIQIQEKIPAAILRRVVKHCWKPFAVNDIYGTMPEVQRIYRLYIRHCLRLRQQEGRKKLKRYLSNTRDLSRIIDWFLAEGRERGLPDKSATWDSLIRASNAWHAQFEEARIQDIPIPTNKAAAALPSWESLLGTMEIAGVSIKPLTSVSALKEEGKAMRHCVASYAARCSTRNFRIFSLTNGKGARSTLCICPDSAGRWLVLEHSGVQNGLVPSSVRKIASEVCRLYEKAEKASRKKLEAD